MACKTISFFFFCFLFISIDSISSQRLSDTETDCSKRWIHIRRLPSRFNLDLLTNCSEYPLFDDFCPYLANHGLGPKTHNKSQSWYRSNPLLLELIFHRRMLEYPCLTSDPSQANAIYLPYYAAIDSLRYLYGPGVNNSMEHGLELYDYLQDNEGWIWSRNHGADHFLVMSRPALDFSQSVDVNPPIWGTSFLELPEFYNLTVLIVEGRAWPWQEQAVPYLTSFHPPILGLLESWIKRVRASKRTTLLLFAGGGGVGSSPNIRRSIRNECENSSLSNSSDVYVNNGGGHDYSKMRKVCDIVDCSNGVCEHDPVRYMRPMLRATFCLQPPGDTPTRRSTFDGIIAGCIPVFFEEQSAKSQYGWHLPEEMYRDFAVFMPKEDIVFKGLRILDVLMGIPRDEVRRMRERVIELIPRVVYRKHGSSLDLRARKDAFDIAVEGALRRIHSRLKARDFDQ
ncbi:probable xyloglucan galactosyltransferase GT19 [Populus alba]|uniref:Xyloglucan galactosyltransferase KATAMARI1-like n=2 Tax=Populus alba TaxID=43335 RepID=A0A4U5PZQ7_POPAL|nr:probable xyloglucan galactosyltransferase GT19 [Populus alba]TKS01155.1 xyloglucan galactosyltransferase KATAMARI1-like [Populus alba]